MKTMKFNKMIFFLLIIAIILGYGYKYLNSQSVYLDENGYYKSKYSKISKKEWESVNHENSGFNSPKELLEEVDRCVERIPVYVGNENWIDRFQIPNGTEDDLIIDVKFTYEVSRNIGGGNWESYIRPSIKLNREEYENGIAPIAHEITHMVSPEYSSRSLSEGLSCYMHDKVGNNPQYLAQYQDGIHQVAKEYLIGGYDEIIDHIGNALPNVNDTHYSYKIDRGIFYVFSHSFATYLIDNYGIDKYMKLFRSETLQSDYQTI